MIDLIYACRIRVCGDGVPRVTQGVMHGEDLVHQLVLAEGGDVRGHRLVLLELVHFLFLPLDDQRAPERRDSCARSLKYVESAGRYDIYYEIWFNGPSSRETVHRIILDSCVYFFKSNEWIHACLAPTQNRQQSQIIHKL